MAGGSFAISTRLITLATLVLPRGPVRDRYARELAAELHAMTLRQRWRYVVRVIVNAPRLRRAVNADPDPGKTPATDSVVPLACRLNLHHTWHLASTEDGSVFKECARCHKDAPQKIFQIWRYPGDDARRSFTS